MTSHNGKILVAVDTEYHPVTREPWSIQWCGTPGKAGFSSTTNRDWINTLKGRFEEDDVCLVFHNSKADLPILHKLGIHPKHHLCTMIMSYLLDMPQSLKVQAYRECGMEMKSYEETVKLAQEKLMLQWLEKAMKVKWGDPPPRRVWEQNGPQYMWEEKVRWVKCSKRNKEKRPCPLLLTIRTVQYPVSLPVVEGKIQTHENCPLCSGTGWVRKDTKKHGKKVEVPGTMEGYWRYSQPQNVSSSLKRFEEADDPYQQWLDFQSSPGNDTKLSQLKDKVGLPPKASLADIPREDAIHYACRDADATLRLCNVLLPQIEKLKLGKAMEIDTALVPMLIRIENNGMKIDPKQFNLLNIEYRGRLRRHELKMGKILGDSVVAPSSRHWLSSVLYGKLGLRCHHYTKKSGEPSTDEKALKSLKDQHPLVPVILKWKADAKMLSTYIAPIPMMVDKNFRVHPTVRHTTAVTGRLTETEPNLMNQPSKDDDAKEYLKGFVAADNHLYVKGDYSQAELRFLAHLTQDPALVNAYLNDQDLHTLTASRIFRIEVEDVSEVQRYQAKTTNFSIIYLISAEGLADVLGISKKEAQWLIDQWFIAFPVIEEWMKDNERFLYQHDYAEEPVHGRKRWIPEIRSAHRWIREEGVRKGCNHPVQAGAQAVIKQAMIDIQEDRLEESFDAKIVNQIHDALVYEVPIWNVSAFKVKLKKIMEDAVTLTVPFKVDIKIGKRWSDVK